MGAAVLAPAIAVCASLTECNLRGNRLGVEGWTIIFNALRDSPTSKIATWNFAGEELGPRITKPLADYISATASMTRLDVRNNWLGDDCKAVLGKAIEGRSGVELAL